MVIGRLAYLHCMALVDMIDDGICDYDIGYVHLASARPAWISVHMCSCHEFEGRYIKVSVVQVRRSPCPCQW